MSFAEIALRVAASTGGWLIFLAHALTLSVLPRADCDPASDELWRGTLLFALLSAAALCFVGLGLPWRAPLRWLALGAAALSLHAIREVLPAAAEAAWGGASLCAALDPLRHADVAGTAPASGLERVWGPIQLAVLAGGLWQALRYWRRAVPCGP